MWWLQVRSMTMRKKSGVISQVQLRSVLTLILISWTRLSRTFPSRHLAKVLPLIPVGTLRRGIPEQYDLNLVSKGLFHQPRQ